MSSVGSQTIEPGVELPVVEGSSSELLSATHVFVVELISVDATPWSPGGDGLEHRRLRMSVKLVASLKGALRQRPIEIFPLEIEQIQEPGGMVSDYHGLWSHAAPPPAAGVGYLVISKAAPGVPADAASLMRDGVCQALLAPALASDVLLAKQGEALFHERLGAAGAKDPELEASQALIAFASAHRAQAKDLFGRYLWARILPSFLRSEARPLREALALLTATDATLELRGECLGSFDRIAPDLGKNPDFARDLSRALVTVLLDPTAATLHPRIVTVSLFFLVFPDEATPRLRADVVLPDPAERARARQAVEKIAGDRGRKLASWLGG